MNSQKFKLLSTLFMMSSILLTSCGQPPSTKNVTIDKHYILMASDLLTATHSYTIYWPFLTIRNRSNADANIEFSYYFAVDGTRVTGPGLAQTVTAFAAKGASTWEMSYNNRMAIFSYTMVDDHYIRKSDVDFCWTVLSVSEANAA